MNAMDRSGSAPARARWAAASSGPVIAATLLAALATLAWPQGATALTPQEQFLSSLGKAAPFANAKARRLCRCTGATDQGVGELRAIFLASNGIEEYGVTCAVPTFNAYSGAVESTRPCADHQFEILAK